MPYLVVPDPEEDPGLCSCCAGAPGLRGSIEAEGVALAVYLAEPAGMPRYPLLRLGLVVGLFTDAATPADRVSLVFVCRPGAPPEPADAYLATFPELVQLGAPLSAGAAAADPRAPAWREMAAAVLAQDPRLALAGGRARHAPRAW